jgi:hypothetical protein
MTDISTQAVREAMLELQNQAEDGLIAKLDLEARFQVGQGLSRQKLNGILKQMVRRGEAQRTDDRRYRFIPEASPPSTTGECWARVFRAARSAKGSFSLDYIIKVAAITAASAKSKIDQMREHGYLEGFRNEGEVFYKATDLLRETPEAPLPPKKDRAPLAQAREAMAELNRIFITLDLASETVKTKVRQQITILQNAFEKGVSDDSQED